MPRTTNWSTLLSSTSNTVHSWAARWVPKAPALVLKARPGWASTTPRRTLNSKQLPRPGSDW